MHNVIVSVPNSPRYLPPSNRSKDNRFEALTVLVGGTGIPCTEEQARIFAAAKKADALTSKWLGVYGFSLIIALPAALTTCSIIPLSAFKGNQDNSKTNPILFAGIFAVISTVFSNICSMLFTGTFPDSSSNTKNAEQNELSALRNRFKDLALYALIKYCNPQEKAHIEDIAQQYDSTRLKSVLKSTISQKTHVDDIFDFLDATMAYIKNGDTLYNSELEMWLECRKLPHSNHKTDEEKLQI